MHPLEDFVNDSLRQYKADKDFGALMRTTIAPFKPLLDAQGVTTAQAVHQLLKAHRNLMSPDLRIRYAQFGQLASFYGINPKDFMATRASAAEEVDAFAADPNHPFFDEVSADVLAYLAADATLTLDVAYESAVWSNPSTRAREIGRLRANAKGEPAPEAAGEQTRATTPGE